MKKLIAADVDFNVEEFKVLEAEQERLNEIYNKERIQQLEKTLKDTPKKKRWPIAWTAFWDERCRLTLDFAYASEHGGKGPVILGKKYLTILDNVASKAVEKYNLTVTANSAKRRLRIIYFEFTPLLKSYQATKQKRRDEESAIKDEKSIGLLSGYRYFDAKRELDETNLTDIVSTVANRSVPDAAMEIAEEIDIPNHCAYMDNDPKMKYSISTQPVFGDLIRGKLVNKVYIQLSAEARYFSIPRRERSALVLPDWVVQGGLTIVEKYDWHIFLNECLSQVDLDGSLTVNPQFKNGWRELR